MSFLYWSLFFIVSTVLLLFLYFEQKKTLRKVKNLVHESKQGFVSAFFRWPYVTIFVVFFIVVVGFTYVGFQEQSSSRKIVQAKPMPVYFFLDASMSTYAGSVFYAPKQADTLFQEEKLIVQDMLNSLKNFRVGLYTYSGKVAVHTPATSDLHALKEALTHVTHHGYKNMGSSLKEVLKEILRIYQVHKNPFHAIILGDGDSPRKDDLDIGGLLNKLANTEVKIHCIGLGSKKGSLIQIFNMEDILTGNRNPRIAKKVTIKRRDDIFEQITKTTGGVYIILEKGDHPQKIVRVLNQNIHRTKMKDNKENKLPFSYLLLFLALLILFDFVVIQDKKNTDFLRKIIGKKHAK